MNRKIMFSLVIIVMALALVIGGTFAWFTATAEKENVFTAGTVMINLVEDFTQYDVTLKPENVNPGDCFKKEFTITNTGSKYFLLRMKLEEAWGFVLGDDLVNPVVWEDILDDVDPELVIKDGIITQLVGAGWIYDPAVGVDDGYSTGYWYYDNVGNLDGYPEGKFEPNGTGTLTFAFDVCFDGPTMGNEFQGESYTLTISFEAIQASNNASGDLWEVDSTYDPDDPESGENWDDWGAPLKP